jgi:hypothetical protein
LAGIIPYSYRDHNLVMAAEHKEITLTYEHDRSQEPGKKIQGIITIDGLSFSAAEDDLFGA